jgi:N-acetylneuraminic acid mutarotase
MKKLVATCLLSFLIIDSYAQNWQTKADVPVNLAFPVVVSLNGNIHVLAGGGPGGASKLHLRYKPSTNKWDTLAPVPFLAQQPAGAVVGGKIHYCGGGYPNSGTRLDKHFVYDPDSAKWFQETKLPVAIAIHKAVEYDNKLYVMSGQPDKALFEYYDPNSQSWVQKSALPDQNFWYGAITSNSKGIFRFGGGGFGAPTAAAHSYNKTSDQWVSIPSLPVALHAASAVALNDSLIFITGGYSAGTTYDKSYIYHIRKQLYYPTNVMPFGTNYHSLVLVDDCIYSVGGDNSSVTGAETSHIMLCNPQYKWAVGIKESKPDKIYTISQSSGKLKLEFKPGTKTNDIILELTDLKGRKLSINNEINGILWEQNFNNNANTLYLLTIKYQGLTYYEKILPF